MMDKKTRTESTTQAMRKARENIEKEIVNNCHKFMRNMRKRF